MSEIMSTIPSNDIVSSLLLFVFSAKLWTTLIVRSNNIANDGMGCQRDVSSSSSMFCPQSFLNDAVETDDWRLQRRTANIRLSIDSPTLANGHLDTFEYVVDEESVTQQQQQIQSYYHCHPKQQIHQQQNIYYHHQHPTHDDSSDGGNLDCNLSHVDESFRENNANNNNNEKSINNHVSCSSQLIRRGSSASSSQQQIRQLNADIMPSKLIMVRHGQSEGNLNELLYATKPDNAMRLTKLGWDMARMAGRALKEQLPPGETVHFIVSPYVRTVETFHGIAAAWSDPKVEFAHVHPRNKRWEAWYQKLRDMGLTWHEDPRIREQDFGNYQDCEKMKKCKTERHKFGSFYYRFPHGESASDVFDRVSTFLDSLWRNFESQRAQNYVLVTHGISIRVFLARYFRYSIDQFHRLANPKNCEMVILGHDGYGRLRFEGRCELELNSITENKKTKKEKSCYGEDERECVSLDGRANNDDNDHNNDNNDNTTNDLDSLGNMRMVTTTVVVGYKKHRKLRTMPPQYIQSRAAEMYYNETITRTTLT